MKFFILLALISAISVGFIYSFNDKYFTKYKGYSVYRILPLNQSHLDLIKHLPIKLSEKFDFWIDPRGVNRTFDLMIKPSLKTLIEQILNAEGLKFKITIQDVGKHVENQINLNNKKRNVSNVKDSFDYGVYHTLDEINDWMYGLEQTYPKYVTVFNVARSYQKRDIYALKICIPNGSKKPALWFDGGIHSREWISPATVIYMTYALLANYNVDPDVTEILNTFDFYVLPVFNVDGYEYTWTDDILWRKTRSISYNSTCIGVDPNRNWDSHFCETGSSNDPCDESYCGPFPFSESETKGVSDFILKNNARIISYMSFHSYSQLWMSPYGYTTDLPRDFSVQDYGSVAAVQALVKINGTQYEHGNIASTIYVASGNSVDWSYDAAGILYSYAIELRDQGEYGFLLPPDQIIPSGLETFEAVKASSLYVKNTERL